MIVSTLYLYFKQDPHFLNGMKYIFINSDICPGLKMLQWIQKLFRINLFNFFCLLRRGPVDLGSTDLWIGLTWERCSNCFLMPSPMFGIQSSFPFRLVSSNVREVSLPYYLLRTCEWKRKPIYTSPKRDLCEISVTDLIRIEN